MVKENYTYIKQQVEETARNCGRNPEDVTLIAVSKTKPLEAIEELITIGVEDLVRIRCRNYVTNMRMYPHLLSFI